MLVKELTLVRSSLNFGNDKMIKYDIKVLFESYSRFEQYIKEKYGELAAKTISEPWAEDFRGFSGHLARISDPNFNPKLDPKNIANPDDQLNYESMLDEEFVEFFRDKQSLRKHWIDRVYNNKSPRVAKQRAGFWMNDVHTFHALDYGKFKGDIVKKLESYIVSSGSVPQLSCWGWVPSLGRKRIAIPGNVTLHIVGKPVFAYNGDAWSEYISTAGERAKKEMPNGLVKTPRTTINPTGVLFNKKDVERAGKRKIGEVIVSDWNISAIMLNSNLSQDIINGIQNIAQSEGISVIIIGSAINLSDL